MSSFSRLAFTNLLTSSGPPATQPRIPSRPLPDVHFKLSAHSFNLSCSHSAVQITIPAVHPAIHPTIHSQPFIKSFRPTQWSTPSHPPSRPPSCPPSLPLAAIRPFVQYQPSTQPSPSSRSSSPLLPAAVHSQLSTHLLTASCHSLPSSPRR